MPWMIPAAIFGGALLGSSASRSAASQQSDAATRAADLQRQQFSEQALLQEPFRQVGIRALPQLEAQRNMMPAAFTGQVNLGQDPGYAFRLQQGIDAMNKSAAARGGLMSGSAIKGGIKFGQDMGSEEYGNAYARYQQNRANQLNALGSFATAGMSAAQNTSATNALYGGQMGDASRAYANTQNELGLGGQARASGYLTGGQEARAAGVMGGQSAMNTGFSNAGSSMQNALLMNRLFPSERAGNAPFQGGFADALPAISNVNQYMPSWVSGRQ